MSVPTVTCLGPVFTRDRSATAPTAVLTLEELLAGSGSGVVLETAAVLDSSAACSGAVTTTVIAAADVPVARDGAVQVTETLTALVQVQPGPAADTKLTPAGSVSVTETALASEGPALATVSRYVTEPPGVTLAGPVLMTERSAETPTVVLAVETLFAGTGSTMLEETVAVLDSVVATPGAVTTTVIGDADVPLARVGTVQVTETFPAFVHVHPAPVADTKATPGGSASVTVAAVASDGPALATARVYVTDAPTTTLAGPVLTIDRSAAGPTLVEAVEVLFAGLGSAVAEDTVAMFDSVTGAPGAVTTTVIGP